MKTKTKTKTVKAWGFARSYGGAPPWIDSSFDTRHDAIATRRGLIACGSTCGPVVRVEVPAPRLSK